MSYPEYGHNRDEAHNWDTKEHVNTLKKSNADVDSAQVSLTRP